MCSVISRIIARVRATIVQQRLSLCDFLNQGFFAIRCLRLRGSFLWFLSETVYPPIKLAGTWIVYKTRNKHAKAVKFLSYIVST